MDNKAFPPKREGFVVVYRQSETCYFFENPDSGVERAL